ncbi:MAG TPA: saccharopine dehydrogenase NADP-binding domain-containing protein [Solirubrobacteraceae bacterium]|nr:saccharopine dehydrogenase NADP-binding domain-containing protein [Solirubrobacteraceae bacterium]
MGGAAVAVIGASGATGRVVAEELAGHVPGGALVLAGRDPARVRAALPGVAPRFDVRAVDVFDDRSLAALCADCDVVVNCAGPSAAVRDRVARAAVAAGAHYVDPGGDEEVVAALVDSWREPADRGLSCVFYAGWIPGLSGVLVRWVDGVARSRGVRVSALDLFCGDSNVWSETGFEDALSLFSRYPGPYSYAGGRVVSRRLAQPSAWRRVALPAPIGRRLAFMCFMSELRQFARESDANVASWVAPLGSPLTGAAMAAGAAMVGPRPRLAARLLRAATARDARSGRAGSGVGVLAARATGRLGGRPASVSATVVERRHYLVTGVACAIGVRMLLDGRLSARGCRYLCDVVDPAAFVDELARRGIVAHLDAPGSPAPPARQASPAAHASPASRAPHAAHA